MNSGFLFVSPHLKHSQRGSLWIPHTSDCPKDLQQATDKTKGTNQ